MNATRTILSFSFPRANIRGIQVSISLLLPFAVAAFMWRLGSVKLGLIAGAVLLFSVLVREFATFFVGRAAGYGSREIAVWPLGGLTDHAEGAPPAVQLQTSLIGPLISFALLVLAWFQLSHPLLLPLSQTPFSPSLLSPFGPIRVLPAQPIETSIWQLTWFVNLYLLIASLLPVMPFEGGRILRTALSMRFVAVEVQDLMLRLGLVAGVVGLLVGFVFDFSTIVALSACILIIHLEEFAIQSGSLRRDSGELPYDLDDEFDREEFGDFESEFEDFDAPQRVSEDADTDQLIAQSGMMARWKARREAEQARREAARRKREEEQVDAILERLHRDGRTALKPSELQLLRQAGTRYRRMKSGEQNSESGR